MTYMTFIYMSYVTIFSELSIAHPVYINLKFNLMSPMTSILYYYAQKRESIRKLLSNASLLMLNIVLTVNS